MSDFPPAQQPEILHQIRTDNDILNDLNTRIHRAAESVVDPKIAFNWRDELEICGSLIYYLTNTYKLKQTLGEEYAYLRQYHKDESVFLSKRRLLLLIFLQCFSGYFVKKKLTIFLQKMKESTSHFLELRDRTSRMPWYTLAYNALFQLDSLSSSIPDLLFFQTALFYLLADHSSIPFRLLGISYKSEVKDKGGQSLYWWIGVVAAVRWGYNVISFILQWYNKAKEISDNQQWTTIKEEDYPRPPIIEEKIVGTQCVVCFDQIHKASSGGCGHVFCWECLVKCVEIQGECPTCRAKIEPQEIIQILNFA